MRGLSERARRLSQLPAARGVRRGERSELSLIKGASSLGEVATCAEVGTKYAAADPWRDPAMSAPAEAAWAETEASRAWAGAEIALRPVKATDAAANAMTPRAICPISCAIAAGGDCS